MDGIRAFLEKIFGAAKEALHQMELADPGHWDDTIALAARVARLALVLFAAVLLVQLVILLIGLLFKREAWKKTVGQILIFAGTLAVVLALCVWAREPLSDAAGDAAPIWEISGGSTSEQADA